MLGVVQSVSGVVLVRQYSSCVMSDWSWSAKVTMCLLSRFCCGRSRKPSPQGRWQHSGQHDTIGRLPVCLRRPAPVVPQPEQLQGMWPPLQLAARRQHCESCPGPAVSHGTLICAGGPRPSPAEHPLGAAFGSPNTTTPVHCGAGVFSAAIPESAGQCCPAPPCQCQQALPSWSTAVLPSGASVLPPRHRFYEGSIVITCLVL